MFCMLLLSLFRRSDGHTQTSACSPAKPPVQIDQSAVEELANQKAANQELREEVDALRAQVARLKKEGRLA